MTLVPGGIHSACRVKSFGAGICRPRGGSRENTSMTRATKSLARLKTDYLDVYFCHRPDPDTPILETASAMHDLIVQGKVMYWGTSEWSPRQIRTAFEVTSKNSLYPPVAEQPPYNLFDRQRFEYQTRPVARKFGLGILSTTPLSSGILSGKYLESNLPSARLNMVDNAWLRERLSYQFEEKWLSKLQDIRHLADDFGITAAQLSIAWCMTDPVVTSVITGASSLRQLQENLATIKFLENLDKSTFQSLKRFGRPRPILREIDRLKFSSRPGRQAAKTILSRLRD